MNFQTKQKILSPTADDVNPISPISIPKQNSPIVKSRFHLHWLTFNLFAQIVKIIIREIGSFTTAIKLALALRIKYKTTFGESFVSKAVKVNGRYFWRLATPGFPSKASIIMTENEINREYPFKPLKGLKIVMIGITKKCPLNCEHCLEWDILHQEEKLSTEDLIGIIHKYQDYGTTQFMLSGGEPMLRVNDIYKILKAAKRGSDFWVVTSGLGVNAKRAQELKANGLTGVMVSLDHFIPAEHDQFRGYKGAFNNAVSAVINSNKAGLVTALSICLTKQFINKENIEAYMDFAKNLGVSFVQFLDPKATGRYYGKDVTLEQKDFELLDELYHTYNTAKKFRDYPIIDYTGYQERRIGCFAAGNRFFYIDTDGDVHVCPFCSNKICNAKAFSAVDTIALLNQHNCHSSFKNENM
jgi:MoaA/NifB/PqqE/SkfB family radical SAM enzyme